MNKKIFLLNFIFFCIFIIGSKTFAADGLFHGRVEEKDKLKKEQNEFFTGETYKLDKKDALKMTVSKVLDGSDVKENDEFFAEVTEDVEGNGGIIIPRGTVAHGYIKRVETAKRFCRNGALDLGFDYIVTPDGKEIHIDGKMSTRLHPVKATSDVIASNLVYATAGGVTGGLLALGMAGMVGTVSSQGAVIAGGAALGGTAGLSLAFYHKGKDVLISPGDEITVKVFSTEKLPVYKKTAFPQKEITLQGLNVKITDVTYKKGLYDAVDEIILTLSVSNDTKNTFSIYDMALVNKAGTVYFPNTFNDETKVFTELKGGEKFNGNIPFSVDDVKNRFWLTFYDHNTRKVVSETSIDNAYKGVSDKKHKENNKLLKKKNDYFKEYSPYENPSYF